MIEHHSVACLETTHTGAGGNDLPARLVTGIGIGLPITEEPSLVTVRTDRVYGDSAVTDGFSSKSD